MTDDEWAAIERPLRLAILEHSGMNRLTWTQVTDHRWESSVVDFADAVLFTAIIEHDHSGYHATITASQDGHPKGATYRRCNSLSVAKAWVRRSIMESD